MDSSSSCAQSPALPAIKQIRRMLCMETEELMGHVDDFSEFVKELNDYSWRLNKKESFFLDCVLRFQKGLVADASFISTVEDVEYCHKEVVDVVFNQTELVKETMCVHEEILALCFNEEEKVNGRIEVLQKELKPLLKRKIALQDEIHNDVTKLVARRHSLVRHQDKQKKLGEDLHQIMANSEAAKKCKHALEDMHHEAVEAAK
ncbi:hypothetical protein A2U01_0012311, partial [Trifolium medium]|nr:hypothetical protein [Trifolium medium]